MKDRDNRPGAAAPSADTTGSSQADSLRLSPVQAGQALRRRAGDILREKAGQSPEDTGNCGDTLQQGVPTIAQTLHELRVHQIELEIQNEELRRAQAELDAARARYFDLYDLAPVGYCTVSENGLILEANLTAATLLGVEKGALVKQPLTRFILRDDQDIYYRHRKLLFETGAPQVCELRLVKKDGSQFWAQFEATVVQVGENGHTVCRAVLSDVTERKRAEAEKAELEAKNRQLQKAESLARMAGAIAHLFNNQLGVVIGNLDLAMMELSQGALPHANITSAMKASLQAAEVSGQMLTYLGQSFDKRESLDLSAACRRSLPMVRAVMPKDMVLKTDLPSHGPAIHTNANYIHQILTNLVTNARESVGDGSGSIHLSVKTVSPADIATLHRFPQNWRPLDHAYACMEVKDMGSGIKEKDIEMLFDPFFTSKFTGRGMGLAVVLGIVRAHGGVVTVESEPGRGSIFRAYFPVYAEGADKATPDPERRGAQGAAGRRREDGD